MVAYYLFLYTYAKSKKTRKTNTGRTVTLRFVLSVKNRLLKMFILSFIEELWFEEDLNLIQ